MNFRSHKGLMVQELGALVLAFVVVAIMIGIGGTILTQVQTTQTANTVAYNATESGLTGVSTFGQWLPTIAVIIAAAAIIGVIVQYFR